MLQATDLQFRYEATPRPGAGSPRGFVIDGVSTTIAAGDVVGILGPNGCGKTTLLKLLSGALQPTRGVVLLDGLALARLSRRTLARRLAVVPQETELAFEYSVLEMVLMGRYPRLGAFEIEGPDDLASAMDALAATDAGAFAARPFRTLSGGERQRVVIASALAQLDERSRTATPPAPALLLLDEPTAALDLKYQLEVAALLTRLNRTRGITIVLSTHDLRFAASVCRRIVLLADGRILAEGPPRAVLTPPLVGALYGIGADLAAPVIP